ncbi:hypothetical protein EYF80_057168 [Liparis tanakae]|uniref:Uncharacterized protein n=1 Tax=Liparis tanakae TaxID=230148 RepID=A0A4Z2EVU1_9TELE|nr:hypothetical protein EYF80_057168 [Liparis tanakae]
MLFGDGTKLDFEEKVYPLVLVYFLSGALTFTSILSGEHNEDNIHYAVVREKKVNRPRRQRNNTEPECFYSDIKQKK